MYFKDFSHYLFSNSRILQADFPANTFIYAILHSELTFYMVFCYLYFGITYFSLVVVLNVVKTNVQCFQASVPTLKQAVFINILYKRV